MDKLSVLLKSRKFWAALIGVLLVVLRQFVPHFPISDDDVSRIAYLLIAFIVGTGLEDSASILSMEPTRRGTLQRNV